MVDWIKIQNEYISTGISYRKLAEKYDVSFSSLEKRARREKWRSKQKGQRENVAKRVRQKTEDRIVASEVNRIAAILSLSDKLAAKLGLSIDGIENDDAKSLQQLSATLKNIKDVAAMDTADSDTLQKARAMLGGVDSAI
ncbi:MAG: helix-turn-helix domain-containing protein [Ruthenibacterium sp.]